MRRPQWPPVAVCTLSGGVSFVITQEVLPGALHQPLRAWGLHFFAALCVSLLTWLLLGSDAPGPERARRTALAIAVPFALLALHELGQWLFPKDPRDTPDSLRDVLMNGLGALTAWWLVRGRMRQGAGGQPPRRSTTSR